MYGCKLILNLYSRTNLTDMWTKAHKMTTYQQQLPNCRSEGKLEMLHRQVTQLKQVAICLCINDQDKCAFDFLVRVANRILHYEWSQKHDKPVVQSDYLTLVHTVSSSVYLPDITSMSEKNTTHHDFLADYNEYHDLSSDFWNIIIRAYFKLQYR